ncbi:YlzJ-like family protein [Metabacillus arenae]|uniref:YlzJ-like family protein n=1 Tax=Metabacillus arenae TaxID=2771434 RepID=A0A926RW74_9BACI|nr:YlzJ-like family protein [Metabacillus arenae]MBD1379265.1 YlzJ-like family protein [Metabacillus arenae]
MILYTMMPDEMVYPVDASAYQKQSVIELNGVQLLVQETNDQQYEIVRLMSNDPMDFLNMQYSPGQKIKMSYSLSNKPY